MGPGKLQTGPRRIGPRQIGLLENVGAGNLALGKLDPLSHKHSYTITLSYKYNTIFGRIYPIHFIGENLEVESLLLLLDMLGNMHSVEYVHIF